MGERSKDLRIPVLESRLANSFEVVHISVSERATSLHHSRTWWMVRSAPRRRRRRPRTSAFASLSYNNNTSENIINVELIKSFCRGGTGEFDKKKFHFYYQRKSSGRLPGQFIYHFVKVTANRHYFEFFLDGETSVGSNFF